MSTPARATSQPVSGAKVLDFMQRRLQRALRQRTRYRYVRPRVLREGEGFRVESPCCSRNVDPDGGVIDIALLLPVADAEARQRRTLWRLHSRDHAAGRWVPRQESLLPDELIEVLCVDAQRVFWP